MHYKNGELVLPAKLLHEIQQYIQGEMLYIPSANPVKAKWGEASGTKAALQERNIHLYADYLSGMTLYALSQKYFLSEDRIRKILSSERRKQL